MCIRDRVKKLRDEEHTRKQKQGEVECCICFDSFPLDEVWVCKTQGTSEESELHYVCNECREEVRECPLCRVPDAYNDPELRAVVRYVRQNAAKAQLRLLLI